MERTEGINLNHPIDYKCASFRYFDPGERHVTRICKEYVLLLVFEGVLRFSENGVPCEVNAGQYYIQNHDTFQTGEYPSSSPRYLYVHFLADWQKVQSHGVLPKRGTFSQWKLYEYMQQLDRYEHSGYTKMECCAVFFQILSQLYREEEKMTSGRQIAAFIDQNYSADISLKRLSEEFHFSKNHIINLFRKEYGLTPIEYIKNVRLREAQRLLEATSKSASEIALECGFHDYSYFYKIFREKNGTSPLQWRSQKRIQPCSYK